MDHTNSLLVEAAEAVALAARYAYYLLYWYNSANTDAEGGARRAGGGAAEAEEEGREERRRREEEEKGFTGLLLQVNHKFTCFTSTKVQILTLTRLPGGHREVLSGRRRRKYDGGYSGCSQHS
jgi:hypothetical protein